MKCLPYAVAVGIFLCSVAVTAKPLSLMEAVNTALAHNPEVTAADQDVAVLRTKLDQVRAQGNPKVTLDATYLSLANTPTVDIPPMSFDLTPVLGKPVQLPVDLPSLPLSNDTISTGMLNVTIPIYTGGRVRYGLAQVQEGVAALQARAESRRRDVAFAVVQTYLSTVLAQRAADVADQAYTTVQQHLTLAQGLFREGQIPRYEVTRAETELANQDRRRLDAHNQVDLALAYLQDLLGTPGEEIPTLTTPLQGNADIAVQFDQAFATALRFSTDMQALEARDRLYTAGIKGAQAETKPVVAAIASKELYINSQPFSTPGTVVGLMAQMPLYDGGMAKARAAEQRALRDRNQSDIQRLENGIRLEVRKYSLDLESARKALTAADKAVELATETLRLATRRFEEGQGTGIEKTDAILSLSLAETNRAQAQFQYDLAYYGLQKATGNLLTIFTAEETAHAAQ